MKVFDLNDELSRKEILRCRNPVKIVLTEASLTSIVSPVNENDRDNSIFDAKPSLDDIAASLPRFLVEFY